MSPMSPMRLMSPMSPATAGDLRLDLTSSRQVLVAEAASV